MKKVEVFEAKDGSLFKTEAACAEYEERQALGPEIEAFMESDLNPYKVGSQATIGRAATEAWEEFKRLNRDKNTVDNA